MPAVAEDEGVTFCAESGMDRSGGYYELRIPFGTNLIFIAGFVLRGSTVYFCERSITLVSGCLNRP